MIYVLLSCAACNVIAGLLLYKYILYSKICNIDFMMNKCEIIELDALNTSQFGYYYDDNWC